ncbi:MAG: SDR family oxidoreductase [Acidobacteria bacterium]|nr:SDR family oxidoreductase [Acidobacteriota bacterium]
MELNTVRAIVTGAARGLGGHFVLELLRSGAHVAAGDIDIPGLRRLKLAAEGLPGALFVAPLDVADERATVAFIDQAWSRLGGLNVLINNAGILRDGLLVRQEAEGRAGKLPSSQWSKVLEVNLTGAFLMARELAARLLDERVREGVIVNVSSLARAGNPGQSSYAASKAGLDAATRTWALELAPFGIRVGGVAPGVIDTPILEGVSDASLAGLKEAIPLGRLGRPDEVWLAVKFIIECDFFTGRTVEVDGGAAMGGA